MDPNHDDDDHPSATNSLPLMDGRVGEAMRPPSFNSYNLEPNRKLKKGRVDAWFNSINLEPNRKLKKGRLGKAMGPPWFNSINLEPNRKLNKGRVGEAMGPPWFNSINLEPNRKLKKGRVGEAMSRPPFNSNIVMVEDTTPPNTANTTHDKPGGYKYYSSWKPNWKLKEFVAVKANTTHEADNIIPEEEAVCRFCFHRLFPVDINNNNVMKTKCGCPLTLTHENCVIINNNNKKCNTCDQDVGYIRVTLSRASNISTKKEVDDKGSSSCSSILTKWSCTIS